MTAALAVDLADSRMNSSSTNRTYDPPEVEFTIPSPPTAEEFLADQNVTDFEQETFGGLEAETVRQYMDSVENPFEDWAREFDKLFYWGL